MNSSAREAWLQIWVPPPRFIPATQEVLFLAECANQFAMQRRWAIVIGIVVTLLFIGLDFGYAAGDPQFAANLDAVVWNRCFTAAGILPVLWLAWTNRFAQQERFATVVLVTGVFVNFLFYCYGFLLVPYPYDYMYFFMGMFINVVFGFSMFRLRTHALMLLMALYLVAAACTFALNTMVKNVNPDNHSQQIYLWAALSYLLAIGMIGYVVSNLLERTARLAFQRASQLATSNTRLIAHSAEVEELNVAFERAVERAEQESAARARVLASASHDLRQPLHALSIYSALLVANPHPKAETLQELGCNIDQIARSLGVLLHGLLDLSQLSSGQYVAHTQEVALDQLLAGVCAEFEGAAAHKGLFLHRQLGAMTVVVDPLAVLRIARNLLDNAIKYTDAGSVGIRLTRQDSFATLTVSDTGKGIARSAQARIFEEFYQLENQGRDRAQGVGLGLAIVQRLVRIIGATITLESQVNAGSRFVVQIPCKAAPPEPTLRTMSRNPPDATARLSDGWVCVLDDELDILDSMAALLSSWGCQVRTARNARDAAALFDGGSLPRLLVADLRLRESETGLSFFRRMVARHGRFPVLFITGETASDVLTEVSQGGWRLLQKPVNVEVLRHEILLLMGTGTPLPFV
ncbi:MAG: hybrid sensor histidine kinase/response regulator [Comamonadaceae bacterium]|nr:MAG: hybrid sensor histidine kinase/response regulator [Comamonadaceae bacterium]